MLLHCLEVEKNELEKNLEQPIQHEDMYIATVVRPCLAVH